MIDVGFFPLKAMSLIQFVISVEGSAGYVFIFTLMTQSYIEMAPSLLGSCIFGAFPFCLCPSLSTRERGNLGLRW